MGRLLALEFRRGTAAQWTSANPTLASGEPGYETDTGRFKVGNGVSVWTALSYSGDLLSYRTVTAATTAVGGDRILANAEGIRPPTMVSATAVAGGGSFAGGHQYYYAVTAVNGSGQESIALMTNAYCTPAAGGRASVTFTNPPGTVSNNVYRVNDFVLATPDAILPGRIATGVAGSAGAGTYTDTFATPTPSATNPPTDNGGGFPITLPSAATATTPISIRANGNTPNLVAVQTVSGQTIDITGTTSIALGQVYAADASRVTLYPDGANWQAQNADTPPLKKSVGGNALGIASVPAGAYTELAIAGPIIPRYGQRVAFQCTVNFTPAAGCSEVLFTVDWCNSSGVVPSVPGLGNMAFFVDYDFAVGEAANTAFNWFYAPRQGDINREGSTDAYSYLRLAAFPFNGTIQTGAACIDVTYGAVGASYYPVGS